MGHASSDSTSGSEPGGAGGHTENRTVHGPKTPNTERQRSMLRTDDVVERARRNRNRATAKEPAEESARQNGRQVRCQCDGEN